MYMCTCNDYIQCYICNDSYSIPYICIYIIYREISIAI